MVTNPDSSKKNWLYSVLAVTIILFGFLALGQLQDPSKNDEISSEAITEVADNICPVLENYSEVSQAQLFATTNDEILAQQLKQSKQTTEHNDSASCLYIESFYYANKTDWDNAKGAFELLSSKNSAESLYQKNIVNSLSLAQLEDLLEGVSKARDEVYGNGSSFNP